MKTPHIAAKLPKVALTTLWLHNRSSSSKLYKGGLCPLVHTLSPTTSRILHSQFFCSFLVLKVVFFRSRWLHKRQAIWKTMETWARWGCFDILYLLSRVTLVRFDTFLVNIGTCCYILVHFGTF